LVRYSPGQQFTFHNDGANRPRTVFIYLNDLPEGAGGETFFPNLGVEFIPRRGAAVTWKNIDQDGNEDDKAIHAGMPPREGTKYAVNCFFHKEPLRVRGVVGGAMPLKLPPLANTEAQDRKDWRTIDPLQLAAPTGGYESNAPPQGLTMFALQADPKLAVIPGFLSAPEIDALLKHCKSTGAEPPSAEEAQLLGDIQQRLAGTANEPLSMLEIFQTSRYCPGMVPSGLSHTGEYGYRSKVGHKNFFLFLEDAKPNQGGELRFPRVGIEVTPRAGAAVFWSTETEDNRTCLSTAHQPMGTFFGQLHVAFITFGRGPQA